MEDVLDALRSQQAELAEMLAQCGEREWQLPSRCVGWTVSDVVLHLAQTNELAIASARDEFPEFAAQFAGSPGADTDVVDAAAALRVAQERDQPGAAIAAQWQRSVDQLAEALRACDPHKRVAWVAGTLSGHTLATTRLAETWIHTGDVADALGLSCEVTDRLWHIARLAWRTLPYAFQRDGKALSGPVAFALEAPDGTPWTFEPDTEPTTTIRGSAYDLCMVAARRVSPGDTTLTGEGSDAVAVLDLVRTYA